MNFNFTINAKTFADKLSALLRVLNNKNALAILDNFKMQLTNGVLTITASNIDNTAVVTATPETTEGDGMLCINARKLTDTIRKLDGNITLSVKDNAVLIKTNTGEYQLQGSDGSEYPIPEHPDTENQVAFETEHLLNAFGAVAYATSQDDYRPVMMGVYIDIKDGAANFVATDTRVLAKYTLDGVTPLNKGIIVSAKTIGLVQSLFGKEPHIAMAFNEHQVVFKNGSVELVATLIAGQFPDYNRVIPKNNNVLVKFDRATMTKAINRVSGFSDNANLLKITFKPLGTELSANDYNMQSFATETIACECDTELTIGFNSQILLQALSAMSADEVTLAMSDASRPAIMTCGGAEMSLLMPMALN